MAPQRLEDLAGDVYARTDAQKAARQAREIAQRAKTKAGTGAAKTPEKPQDVNPPSEGRGKAPATQQRAAEAGSRANAEPLAELETMPEGEAADLEAEETEGTPEKEDRVYPLDVEKTREAIAELVEDDKVPGLETIAAWAPRDRAQARAWAAACKADQAPDLPEVLAAYWGVATDGPTAEIGPEEEAMEAAGRAAVSQSDEAPAVLNQSGPDDEAKAQIETAKRLPEGAGICVDGSTWTARIEHADGSSTVGIGDTASEAVDNFLEAFKRSQPVEVEPAAKTDPVAPAGEQGQLFDTAPEPVQTTEPSQSELDELFEIHESIRQAQTEVLEAKQELEAAKAKCKDREQQLAARYRELNEYVGDMSRGQRHIVAPPPKAKPLPLVEAPQPAEQPKQEATPTEATATESPEPAPLKLHMPEDESWRDTSLVAVEGIGETIGAKLAEAGLTTVGELADWSAGKAMGKEGPKVEGRQITWIKGIGPETAEKIENAMLAYHKKRSRTVDIVTEGA
jgi:predicted flap endonuclease-1-like 5' DNA nuclease